jgi:hypothetical protein
LTPKKTKQKKKKKKKKPTRQMLFRICALAVAALAVVIVLWQRGLTNGRRDASDRDASRAGPSSVPPPYAVIEHRGLGREETLARLRRLFADPASESDAARPEVFRGAFATRAPVPEWSAGAAGLAAAAAVIDTLEGVYETTAIDDDDDDDARGGIGEMENDTARPLTRNATVLYYNDDKPLAGRVPITVPRPHTHGRARAAEVLRGQVASSTGAANNNPADVRYFYYSGKLGDTPRVRAAVGSVLGFPCPHGEEAANENLWVGTRGVVARAHYDSFHNAFAQVAGRKAFLLRPPAAHAEMRLHPRAHPSYRQAQVDGYASLQRDVQCGGAAGLDAADAPETAAAEVILEPGDVLYLPPFHFHQVSALDASVSINAWCDSRAYWEMDRAIVQPVPLEADWPVERKVAAVREYLGMLWARILGGGDDGRGPPRVDGGRAGSPDPRGPAAGARAFFTALARQRHALGALGTWYTRQRNAQVAAPKFCSEPGFPEGSVDRTDMWRGVDLIAPYFDRVSTSLREIHLGNYAEDLIGFFFGDDQVPAFIQSCLAEAKF